MGAARLCRIFREDRDSNPGFYAAPEPVSDPAEICTHSALRATLRDLIMASGLQFETVMRTALVVACLGVLTASLVGCGDASSSAGIVRRGGPPSTIAGGETDGQETDGSEDDVDNGNPNANAPPQAPSSTGTGSSAFDMALSTNTPAVDLGESLDLDVTITPKAGATGNADLSVTGLPDGVTATFAPAQIALGAAPVKSKLTLKAAVTTVPSAAGASAPIVVTGKSGAVTATANANFKINPKAKLTIPVNIDALRTTGTKFLDQWGREFGAAPLAMKTQQGNPIVFTVFNADSKPHIVHGNNGFAHGSTTAGQEVQPGAFEMQNGAPRTRSLNPGANVNGYPHEGGAGQSAGFQISVQQAP